MAVTWGAAGTAASGTTSCTPSYPTGVSALTSKILCAVTGRSNTADTAFTMPAGWTKIGSSELESGTGTWGVDTGTRRVTFFRKDATVGDETGTVTVSLTGTTANTLRATIFRVEVTSGYGIEYEATTGADTTNGTGFSATGGSIDFAPGDLLAILVAQNIDSGTQSAQAIAASGVTFGTRTNRASTAVTNGRDHRHILDTVPVSSGTASAPPTYSYTISVSGSGPVAFLRMREVSPPVVTSQPTNAFVIDGDDASFTLAGTGYASVKWQELIAGEGGGAAYIEGSAQPLVAGANAITIPSGAVSAVLLSTWWHGAASTPSWACTALPDLNTNRMFVNGNSGPPYQSGMLRTTSGVTATGAQTLTLSGQTEIYNGPGGFILFFDGEIEVIDGDANSVGDTGSAGITLDSEAGAIVIVLDSNLDTTTPPSTPGGWTELETVGNNNLSATLRMKISAGSSESITSTSPNYETLIAFSIRGGAGSTWTDVSGATTTTLGLTGVTTDDDGRKFRGVLTSPVGSTTSNEVTLYVSADGRIEYVAETTGGVEVAATSANVGAISLAEGDLDILLIGAGVLGGDAPAITTPAGWTKFDEATDLPLATVVNTTLCVFWRNSLGSGAGFTVSADASALWGWTRIAYRFHDPADPIEASALGHLAASTAHVLPGYTASKDDHLYIGWISQAIAQGATVPSPMVRRINDEAGGIVLGDEQIGAIGATGSRTFSVDSLADTVYAVMGLNSLASDAGGGSATDLTVADTSHAHTLEAVTLTLDTHLAPADLGHVHALDAVTLSTDVALAPADLSHGHTLDAVVLSTATVVSLVVADLLHAHDLDDVALTLDTHLAPADLSHGHALDAVALSSDTALAPVDLQHAHSLEAVTLDTTTGVDLEPADLAHTHALDAVSFTLDTTLAPAGLAHAHSLDAAPLGLDTHLALADLLHVHALDAVSLSTENSIWLAPADLQHAHTLDAVPLAADSWLSVAGLTHGHALEAFTLATLLTLTPADLSHAHALEAVTLSDVPWLGVADLTHAHTLDVVTLSSASTLTVADLFHQHRMDSPALTSDGDVYEFDPLFTAQPIRRGWTAEAVERAWDASPVARIWRAS